MSSNRVIVFGPTGGVGSAAALAAQQHGAKVFLAMRDTTKPIPNLSPAREQALGFERVQADLAQPDTVRAAAAQSGAKHAFIYLTFASPDHMRSAAEALRAAGVEFVVFLSSSSIRADDVRSRSVAPDDFIAWRHAQVEIALDDTFGSARGGLGYAAVRPGYFASNVLPYKKVIAAGGGVVRMPYPEARFDFVAPVDIGRVCGALLAKGPTRALTDGGGKNAIMVCGPQLMSQREAVGMVAKVMGKQVEVESFADDEESVRFVVENLHLPEPGARQLVGGFRHVAEGGSPFDMSQYEQAVANIQKYGGREPTKFGEWLEANRASFVEA